MIIGVAVKHGDLITCLPKPNRHHHVIRYMIMELGLIAPVGHQGQGFYDDQGNYLDRKVARKIAIESGQCLVPDHPTELFSEDLW